VSRHRFGPSSTLLTLVFLSGFTSLAYELVFYKLCGYLFGTSNLAVTTVLVAFMGGLAIGSRAFGAIADRVRRPIVLYGFLELFIGAYVLLVPFLMRAASMAYVAIGLSADVRNPSHTAVQFIFAVVILLPPTAAMGGTLPVLIKALVRDHAMAETKVARLYGVNTLGAALGTLATNYLLLRFMGLGYLLVVGSLVNVLIFLRARRLDRELANAPEVIPVAAPQVPSASLSFGFALGAVFITGFLSFVCEVVWTHLLATIVGLSVYAFGLMLFTFLLGIALGSLLIVPRLEQSPVDRRGVLAWLQIGAGAYLLATFPLWDKLSFIFSAAGSALDPGFALREIIRGSVCMVMLLPPCLAIGATFPILIRSAATAADANLRRLGHSVGTLYAVNTAGCILGAIATGFLLLQALGSRRILLATGAAYVFFGLAFVGRKRPALLILVPATVLALVLLPSWDIRSLVSGRSIYFAEEAKIQELVFLAEDPEGGFTSVTREPEGLVLRSDGKHQGNDGFDLDSQHGFALLPLFFAPHMGNVLHIGLGTGATAGAFSRFPITSLEIAELSPGVVAADRYFEHLNFGVLRDPRVRLHLNDGRNQLLLSSQHWDVISVGVSGIWLAGAGNVYSSDFYDLCKSRLVKGGVLQQWIPLHHIAPHDVLVVINTLRHAFGYVSLWVRAGHGILIATDEPQQIDYARVMDMNHQRNADPLRERMRVPDFFWVLGDQILEPEMVDLAVQRFREEAGDTVSSDMFPYIEYATPMGTTMPHTQEENMRWILRLYRAGVPVVVNVPDEPSRRRIQILMEHRRGRCAKVQALFAGMPVENDRALQVVARDCKVVVSPP